MLQCRVRTCLQLMGCALILELGVLISEQVKRCDSAECDKVRSSRLRRDKVIIVETDGIQGRLRDLVDIQTEV